MFDGQILYVGCFRYWQIDIARLYVCICDVYMRVQWSYVHTIQTNFLPEHLNDPSLKSTKSSSLKHKHWINELCSRSTGTDPNRWILNKQDTESRLKCIYRQEHVNFLKRAILHKVSFSVNICSGIRSMWIAIPESTKAISYFVTPFLFEQKV